MLQLHVATALVVLTASLVARAQTCSPQWLPGEGVPGVNGEVYAIESWDPDGPGPASSLIVVGGEFSVAGDVFADNIAAYDQRTGRWFELGGGTDGLVRALVVLEDGSLLVGGGFTRAGEETIRSVARWDGTSWSGFADGLSFGGVNALAVLENGDIVAAGQFTVHAPAGTLFGIARWNGSEWLPLGTGTQNANYPVVNALAVLSDGTLVAGGRFNRMGGVTARGIARWDGVGWGPVGLQGVDTGSVEGVYALATLPGGDLVAGGVFSLIDGMTVRHIARWNGSVWNAFGSGAGGSGAYVFSLRSLRNGDLVAGGQFTSMSGTSARHIARWNGTAWSAFGTGLGGNIYSLAETVDGDVVAGSIGIAALGSSVARWDGTVWSSLGEAIWGSQPEVRAIARMPTGEVISGGYFVVAGGAAVNSIAQWSGSGWSALGSGLVGPGTPEVNALAITREGHLIAAGMFDRAGGVDARNVARWDGESWFALGAGTVGGQVFDVAALSNGDVVVAGTFFAAGGLQVNGLALWDGVTWSSMQGGVQGGTVQALLALPNGDLIVGGGFTSAGGQPLARIARWNQAGWSEFAPGLTAAASVLALMPNGDIAAATDAGIAVWDGVAWTMLGPSFLYVQALSVGPGGILWAGGTFTIAAGGPGDYAAWWDGERWNPAGSGLNDRVRALCDIGHDELAVGGRFTRAGGLLSTAFARWTESNSPWIAVPPRSMSTEAGSSVVFTCVAAEGTPGVACDWEFETSPDSGSFMPLRGGPIPGAEPAWVEITPPLPGRVPGTAKLSVHEAILALDQRRVRAVVSNECASATSPGAMLLVTGCAADFNTDGQLDFFDYLDFAQAFSSDDPAADFDANGQVDFFDYLDFAAAFDAGCE